MAKQFKAALATVVLAGAAQAGTPRLTGPFPLMELRQYTLHPGQRDTLIELFEREFIESQEALGMKVIGTFTDLDRPDHFVWLRGFKDMDSRAAGLTAFYGGPVWQAHRTAANATMIDSDNVLLLRAPDRSAGLIAEESRPPLGEPLSAWLVVATIHYLKVRPADALRLFEAEVKPKLDAAGGAPIAWFLPETAANNFPRLPVREGERVLVWFARFTGPEEHAAARPAVERALQPLAPLAERPAEVLRLQPTARSALR